MDVVVLADTHLRAGISSLHPRLLQALSSCDRILHAGDIVSPVALRELEALAPCHAVLGNNDRELVGSVPVELGLELDGVSVSMLHDAGRASGRAARLARRFPAASLVVFGHSHVPLRMVGDRGQLLFNPGSPTQRRRQPAPSFGRLRLEAGVIRAAAIEFLPLAPGRSRSESR